MFNDLTGVQWTLLIPLMSRARITLQHPGLLNDPKSIGIVERLSGSLSKVNNPGVIYNDLGNAARARTLDDAIKNFIKDHPKAAIVNLGSGFDTAFSRVDNGEITWYDVDLPDIIDIRKLLIPETDRSHCIACSILDNAWTREINPQEHGLFMIAGGVLPYFTGKEVKRLIKSIADHLPQSEFVFDAVSWIGRFLSNRVIKKAGISSAPMNWVVNRRINFNKWDSRVVVVEHVPIFAHIKRSPDFDKHVVRIMNRYNKLWNMSIVHLKFSV